MIHRTISLWVSSTEVDDEEGPGDQSRSGLSPHELRRELDDDTEDMVWAGVIVKSSTKVHREGSAEAVRGDQVYIRISYGLPQWEQ